MIFHRDFPHDFGPESVRVAVYFNLHKKVFSVKALQGPHKGRVVAHVARVTLRDAAFKVNESGRQRVLREKRKNVHAYVTGYISGVPFYDANWIGARQILTVSYNPFRAGHFHAACFPERAVRSAALAHLTLGMNDRPLMEARGAVVETVNS